MTNKLISDLKNEIYSLKINFYKNHYKSIEENIYNLLSIANKLDSNTNLSRTSSEFSIDFTDIINLPNINIIEFKNKLNDWNYDFFKIKNKNDLINDVYFMFTDLFNFDELKIDLISMYNCIIKISNKYNNNPYHNFRHAVTVTHFIYLIIKNTQISEYLSKNKLFGLLFSGLVHDIDHPGTDNLFEINKKSVLAFQYNDSSVLENYHCSTAFYIIQHEDIKLFKNLNNIEFLELRSIIIECIMATDMKNHHSLISCCKTTDILLNQTLICKLIMHGADLCNQLKCFSVYKNGINRIYKEMINQKEQEEKLDITVTKKIDINNDNEIILNEINFSSYFVKPLWEIIVKIFPELEILLKEHNNNIDYLLKNNYSSFSESDSDI